MPCGLQTVKEEKKNAHLDQQTIYNTVFFFQKQSCDSDLTEVILPLEVPRCQLCLWIQWM